MTLRVTLPLLGIKGTPGGIAVQCDLVHGFYAARFFIL